MDKRVLAVDDDPGMCHIIEGCLVARGFQVESRSSAQEALETLRHEHYDLVVADMVLHDANGLELCANIHGEDPDLPVVIITGQGSMQTAIEAIRVGAWDYLTKPVETEAFTLTVEKAIKNRELRQEVKRLRQIAKEAEWFGELAGKSPAMKKLFEMVRRVGATDTTVLISGETGTGKELIARTLHEQSLRRTGAFVAINCAAMPANLLESELFGHVRGAFTGASKSRPGLLVEASAGTLFLDEIGEMPVEMQPKLLRVIQERKVRPIGGDQEVAFDTRILAATNRDLEAEVSSGRFREDLYYRLNVVQLHAPALRQRGSDILILAQHFIDCAAARLKKPVLGLSSAAATKLLEYAWPGNVRELENAVERAVTLTRFDRITPEDLPEHVRDHDDEEFMFSAEHPDRLPTLEELERRYIPRVLDVAGGNKTRAARLLGVDRRTLYRKLERYSLESTKS